jgi:endonuclease YncB( thermonuclease family)
MTRLCSAVVVAVCLAGCAPLPQQAPRNVPPVVVPHAEPAAAEQPCSSDRTFEDSPVLLGTVTKVVDGDTIHVLLSSGPIKVRFSSSDAPEKDQRWGPEATAALAGRLTGQQVALEVVEQDRYDRMVATVYLHNENLTTRP